MTILFQRYENSPMSTNRYGILEPKLNCSHVSVAQLDYILTPLVAFDSQGVGWVWVADIMIH